MILKHTSLSRRDWLVTGMSAAAWGTAGGAFADASQPVAFGAVPSPRQLSWHALETYAFVHFTINTFTDREWGFGDESPQLFNPTDFSADQITGTAQAAGLKALILTAKHHDGFCLWPSRFTEHSIRNSPYKGGKGDIVGELAQACRRHGLKFGIYLSPWDRNHADYGREAYVTYYHNQLHELTTQYGDLFEVWFDGANGGDGYYGGARETRKIHAPTYYRWEEAHAMVRRNQPEAVMFADAGTDVRWVGNEEGRAGDPCWPTVDDTPFTREKGNTGVRNGPIWNPAEVDVSLRPGWFWHAAEAPRSATNLMQLYFQSVGRGANLLLNLAPDRRGWIPDQDVQELVAWKALRDDMYRSNLAKGARIRASSSRGGIFRPANLMSEVDAWAAADSDRSGAWIEALLPEERLFDVVRFAEDIRYGVRIESFAVDVLMGSTWTEVAQHQCIGYQRLVVLDEPVRARGVRLRCIRADAAPMLRRFGLFLAPSDAKAKMSDVS